MRRFLSALGSPAGRASLILIAGIGGGYYLHSLLTPSPRPVLVYPIAVPLAGALAAVQLRRVRLRRCIVLAIVGALMAVWVAELLLPLPGPRLYEPMLPRSYEPLFWYRAILLSAIAAIVGLIIGFVYAMVAVFVRWLRRQSPPPEIPLRFSLQKLFVAITLLAMFFGATAFRLQQFLREQKLADRWSRAGVSLTFDYWGRPHGAWTVPNSSLDDTSLAELADLTNLRALNLCGTQVSDAGMTHLKRLTRLRYLNLGGLPITDASVSHLSAMPSLQFVDLFGTKTTPAAIATFAAQRPQITIRVQPRIIQSAGATKRISGIPGNLTIEVAKFPYWRSPRKKRSRAAAASYGRGREPTVSDSGA